MSKLSKLVAAAVAAAAVAVLGAGAGAAQVGNAGPDRFTAFAINMNASRPSQTATTVDIVINRYSTDNERDTLREMFRTNGQDGLLKALQRLPAVGYLTTPGSLRYDVHFARQRPLAEGGRRIFLLTDRRINYWEAASGSRTLDYPFTLVELQLDKNDTGVGKLNIAAKITGSEESVIEIEDFAAQPVQLNNVHRITG